MRVPRRGHGCPSGPGEAGFALVEVMVSAVLLIVLAMATFPVLEQAGSRASADRGRAIATSLAQAEQDRLRQLPIDRVRNVRASQVKEVEGIDFLVKSRTDVTRDAGGVVACTADTSKAEYFRSQTTVTWPGMAGTAPVVIESIINPGVEGMDPGKGTLTVKLQNAAGGPQPNVSVTAGPFSDVTDQAGCAVFTGLPAGLTDVTFSAAGMVDRDGDAVGGGPDAVNVVGNATSTYSDQYDRAATVPIVLRDEAGQTTTTQLAPSNPQIAWPAITLKSGLYIRRFPPSPSATAPQSSITATSLFPFTAGYTAHAGTCDGMDPTAYKPDYYTAQQPQALFLTSPGQTMPAARAVLRKVDLYVRRTSTAADTVRVRLFPASVTSMTTPSGCAAVNRAQTAYVHPGGASGSTQTISALVPYGHWRVCVDDPGAGRRAELTGNMVSTPPGSATASTVMTTAANTFDLRTNATSTTGVTVSSGTCSFPT